MFRVLYIFFVTDPPSWVGYVHAAVLIGLMALAYIQSTRRGVGFMILFVALAGIFMVDVLAYVPFYAYLRHRDSRRGASAAPASAASSPPGARAKKPARGGQQARPKRRR